MPYTAKHRFARITARKVKRIVDLIRGQRVDQALEILRYQPHRGARMVEKVLKSALGNAEDQRASDVHRLVVVDARADVGPMVKRVRPQSRGMAYLVKKRMSHITVTVDAV